MTNLSYGFVVSMGQIDFETARDRVVTALKVEGFGVLTEIDVKATFEKKLDRDFRPYTILGACNPHLAWGALQAEPHLGLMLPCNVALQQMDDGELVVSIADPGAMFKVVDAPGLAEVAAQADEKLRRVAAALG